MAITNRIQAGPVVAGRIRQDLMDMAARILPGKQYDVFPGNPDDGENKADSVRWFLQAPNKQGRALGLAAIAMENAERLGFKLKSTKKWKDTARGYESMSETKTFVNNKGWKLWINQQISTDRNGNILKGGGYDVNSMICLYTPEAAKERG